MWQTWVQVSVLQKRIETQIIYLQGECVTTSLNVLEGMSGTEVYFHVFVFKLIYFTWNS